MGPSTDPGPSGTALVPECQSTTARESEAGGRSGLTTHGALGNRGLWGPCVLAQLKAHPKMPIKRYQGHFMGPTTDPGPSGNARVLKWSVRPC
ncbi:unnamed protein product, partial [Staurois parvus]